MKGSLNQYLIELRIFSFNFCCNNIFVSNNINNILSNIYINILIIFSLFFGLIFNVIIYLSLIMILKY